MNNTLFQDKMVNSNRILYTPTPFAKKNLMHLQEIGTLQALSEHASKRTGLASYLFFCVKSGFGTLIYNNTIYTLSAGDCVFIDCHQPYEHNTSSELWSLQWAHFYGEGLDYIYSKFYEDNLSPVFSPLYIRSYENILTELQEIASDNSSVKDLIICEKLMALLAQTLKDCEKHSDTNSIPLKNNSIIDVKKYLDAHFNEKISLDDLGGLFFIDKYYLSRRFKQHFGTTINSYLQQCRITHAKRLLRFSRLSIEEIASTCGIEDPNYFSRLFKKIEGISPGDFRRSWSGLK